MHRTEECDQLLVDTDSVPDIQSYEKTRDSQSLDVQFDSSLSKHAMKFAHRPASLFSHQNSHDRQGSDTFSKIFKLIRLFILFFVQILMMMKLILVKLFDTNLDLVFSRVV